MIQLELLGFFLSLFSNKGFRLTGRCRYRICHFKSTLSFEENVFRQTQIDHHTCNFSVTIMHPSK